MTQDFFARSGFSTPLARQDRFLPIVSAHYPKDTPLRLLDVGCGNGEQLLNLVEHFPHSNGVGIDISAANIAAAVKNIPAPLNGRIEFFCADILSWDAPSFDAIISDSVVQNIPNGPYLLRRLAALLKPGALLLLTMPYDGLYNRSLWGLRRIARLLAGPSLERVLLRIALQLHPDWDIAMIRERLGYMYLLPYSRDGKAFRAQAQENDLRLAAAHALPHVSLAQPKHRMLVFRRDPT
jgi:SAM-dependent methyltransferase